jgi:transcriptional regulator with XRE-family HTH domain
MAVAERAPHAGELLREWRTRRKLSQLELALSSAVSARHLSFIETGRARPSREMVLHLAQRLEVPLRERNHLLVAAGYAPVFGERSLEEPEMARVRDAIDRFLAAHEPYPALVVDRRWNIVAANRGVEFLTRDVAPELLEPPANAFRIALHPEGLAPRIVNMAEWSQHLLYRLQREITATRDPELQDLYDELVSYPDVDASALEPDADGIVFLHELRFGDDDLVLFSTVTTFGTARDVTLAELAIEAFYPADAATAAVLAAAVGDRDRITRLTAVGAGSGPRRRG